MGKNNPYQILYYTLNGSVFSNDNHRYYVTGDIDDVKNTLAIKNTIFVNNEMNTLWLKDVSGNIKTYTLTEVIELDEILIHVPLILSNWRQTQSCLKYHTP